jgi:hypothetical protein
MTRSVGSLVIVLALLCGGCVAPVAFTSPCAPGPDPNNNSCAASAPVTSATIAFASNFDPAVNDLTVAFDGQNVTNTLTPAPVANGTSTFPLPASAPAYYTTASHTLTADAICGFFCVFPTKTVTFTVPRVQVSGQGENFPNVPVSASLTTPTINFAQSTLLGTPTGPVTLTASPPIVLFGATPNGAFGATLTVQVNGQAQFYVKAGKGASPKQTFTVTGTAPGLQLGTQAGVITP